MAGPINMDQFKIGGGEPRSSPTDNAPVSMENYKLVPKSITNPEGGGVASYIKDTGKAVVRGTASLLDLATGFNNLNLSSENLFGEPSRLPKTPHSQEWTPYHSFAKEQLPYENKIFGESMEGAVAGAPFGGAIGATMGAIASGGTEALNQYNPDSPIFNTLAPIGVSLLAGPAITKTGAKLAKLGSEGLGLTKRPELIQAQRNLGITDSTAASTSNNPLWHKMQRGLRERITFPGSGNIEKGIEAERQQLGSAVERQADSLFSAQSRQELGQGIQSSIEDGVDTIKRVFSRQEQALDRTVNPTHTRVNMIPYVDKAIDDMASVPGAHIPLTGGKVQSSDKIVTNLMENIILDAKNNPGNTLSVAAIREHKQKVGDALKESLLNGNANKRELSQIYGILADAQGEAYGVLKQTNPATGQISFIPTTPQAQQYLALKAAEAEMYKSIESFAEPLIRRGITPEKMADLATNQMKLGGTKLNELVTIMEQANPTIRNQLGSSILLNLGKDAQMEFSPQRFLTRWSQIAPEAKQALFGRGPNQDIPKIYDELVLAAKAAARGGKAINTSGTAGTAELYHEFARWGAFIGGTAGLGYGTSELIASKQDQAGRDDETSAILKGGAGAGMGAIAAGIAGPWVLGKLMTNNAFLRWIATPGITDIPKHAKALSVIAAESPEIKPAIDHFQQYLEKKSNPPKFAEGGYNTFLTPQEERLFEAWKRQHAPNDSGMDYDLRGAFKAGLTPDTNNHWSDEFKKPNHPTFSEESKYSRENPQLPAGRWNGEQFIPPDKYDEGGIIDASQSSGSMGPHGTMYYAAGGPSIYYPANDNASLLDRFFRMRQTLPAITPMGNPNQGISPLAPALQGANQNSKIKGFTSGGAVNDNDLFGPTNLIRPRFGGYSGADRTPVTPSSIGVDMNAVIKNMPQGGSPRDGFAARPGKGGAQWGTNMSQKDIQEWTKDKIANIHTSVDQDIKHNKSIIDSVLENSPLSSGSPRAGFVGSMVTKRGVEWDTKSPMKEWSPPFDINDAANDLNFAEGGPVDRFQQAVQYLTKETGMPEHAAKGAVKYMYKNESRLDPDIVNPTSGAYGIAQHLGPRKRALMSKYGNKPSFEQQLEFIKSELFGPEKSTLKELLSSKDEKHGYDIWGRLFERPGEAALRKAGVNYSSSTPSIMASTQIPNLVYGTNDQDNNMEEEESPNETLKNALTASVDDPVTKSIIEIIMGKARGEG